jgi:hypothetical protein
MKCSDVDRILPDIVDGAAIDGSQGVEVQSHLKTCPDCLELVSDLKLIASEARDLAASEEPSPRVWARIAIELRAEGLIREPDGETAQLLPVPPRQRRWNPFWLAPVAAAVLAAGAYVLSHKPTQPSPVAEQTVAQQSQLRAGQQAPSQQPATHPSSAQQSASQQIAQQKPPAPTPGASSSKVGPVDQPQPEIAAEEGALSQPTVADDNQFLTEVSQRAPTMRATYTNQLQAVNNEIRETQAYITQYPGDVDARQHLLEVYQQKAMLYSMALDRIQ